MIVVACLFCRKWRWKARWRWRSAEHCLQQQKTVWKTFQELDCQCWMKRTKVMTRFQAITSLTETRSCSTGFWTHTGADFISSLHVKIVFVLSARVAETGLRGRCLCLHVLLDRANTHTHTRARALPMIIHTEVWLPCTPADSHSHPLFPKSSLHRRIGECPTTRSATSGTQSLSTKRKENKPVT